MDWREFFKPRLIKIILTVLLIILAVFIAAQVSFGPIVSGQRAPPPSTLEMIFLWPLPIIEKLPLPPIILFILFILSEIIYFYLVSCILVFAYKKMYDTFQKKKKSEDSTV